MDACIQNVDFCIFIQVALTLIGNHADEILSCDSFESIVDYMKINLPEKVVDETDDVCSRALNMDIKTQLNLYEVEYQLLREEMIDIRQNKERLEKQEVAHKELENEVAELRKELKNAKEMIGSLKKSLGEANAEKKKYETKFQIVRNERDALRMTLNEIKNETDGSLPESDEVKHNY